MTATEVSAAAPTENAMDTKESTSKEASPVKTQTPEQVQEEANTLLATGKRDLLLNNVPEAVSNLAKACELLSKQFGETAKECAEVYYYYGKSLLELSRMESGVLGNALDGVPEEESESNTSQFEDPSKLSDKEKTEVTEKITDALEENFDELEKKKEEAEAKKDATSKVSETKEGTEEAKKTDSTEETKKTESTEEAKKTDAKEDSKEEKKAEAEKSEESKEGDNEDEAMEEDEEGETEEETEESSDEKKEGDADEKKDEEEPSNLQLAWEMLELAKVVYTKQHAEAKEEEKLIMLEKLCCTMCALGEVSIESENYKQAVEDFQECLKKQSAFPKDSRYAYASKSVKLPNPFHNFSHFRCVAETHYQLGVALGYHAEFDEAVTSLKSAISIIQERITTKEKDESEEAKKEVTELKALVPEIEEKIKDTEDMKKEAENKKTSEAATSSSGDAFGSEKAAEVKPVSSIAVKRKAEDEDSSSKKLATDKETAAAS